MVPTPIMPLSSSPPPFLFGYTALHTLIRKLPSSPRGKNQTGKENL